MTVLSLQVRTGSDDARNIHSNGTYNGTLVTYRLGNDGGTDVWVGWRFVGNLAGVIDLTPLKGATINSATLDLFSAQTGQGSLAKIILYGEAADDPVAFANTTANKPQGRTRTTANEQIEVNVSTFNASSAFGNWPIDVTALIQEIVNRAGFAGNAIVLVAHDNGSAASNNIGFANYESSGNAKGAKLVIDYTEASEPPSGPPAGILGRRLLL